MARGTQAHVRKDSGFTIVELLIVIVVIAILAAISIVSFTGIQTRAENSKTLAAVQVYAKALQQYYIDNNDYPNTRSCLGEQYGAGGCRTDGYAAINQDNFNSVSLAPYVSGAAPTPSTKQIRYTTSLMMAGAAYYYKNSSYYIDGAGFGVVWLGGSECPAIGGLKSTGHTDAWDGQGKLCRYGLVQ